MNPDNPDKCLTWNVLSNSYFTQHLKEPKLLIVKYRVENLENFWEDVWCTTS